MSESTDLKTADLCDAHAGSPGFQIAEPGFLDYGGRRSFSGPISTVRAPEDNSLVRKALEEPGQGRVLVVDGGGSRRCRQGVTERRHIELFSFVEGINDVYLVATAIALVAVPLSLGIREHRVVLPAAVG